MPNKKRLIQTVYKKIHDNFYSGRPWRRLRLLKLTMHPFSEVSKLSNTVARANTVDHRLSRRFWPELSLELTNLISMTEEEHNIKRLYEAKITTPEGYKKIFGI